MLQIADDCTAQLLNLNSGLVSKLIIVLFKILQILSEREYVGCTNLIV